LDSASDDVEVGWRFRDGEKVKDLLWISNHDDASVRAGETEAQDGQTAATSSTEY